MNTTSVGALLLALAVALGAFGAHGLKDRLSEYALSIWEKAVFYHFVHALGIFVLGRTASTNRTAVILLSAGILLFSGSLYLLAITGVKWLGAVTPLGGIAFILGWILLAVKNR